MDEEKIELCRRTAEQCRIRAQTATGALEKESWLKLAEGWLELAEATESIESKPTKSAQSH